LNNPKNSVAPLIFCRLKSELPLKLTLLVVLNLCVYVPYLFLQRHHFFPATNMSPGFLDRMIPFSDQTTWLYLSIYLLMPIGPFLMNTRLEILRYAAGIFIISLLVNAIFLFWPTYCPRPDATGTRAIYRALVSFDQPYHAFPSLHAAFAVYSACCGGLVFRELHLRWPWRIGLWLWALLILLATLATKQHVIVDIAAGSALALGAYCCAFNPWIHRSKATHLRAATTNPSLTDPTAP
jgi:membrane-associated phospholipid phosphatase